MFFNSKDFKALEAGVQMSWTQQQLHLQNISNIETPGYKSKSLTFSQVFDSARSAQEGPDRISARVVEDPGSVLQDGNNVDIEKENVELYKSYVQYSLLMNKISGSFDKYNYVLNCNMK